jgi:hypothetical protein
MYLTESVIHQKISFSYDSKNNPIQKSERGYNLIMEDFGIIIACCDQDYLFAQGTCASIRYFMGDIPICLLVDGISSSAVRAMERTYGVKVITRQTVSDEFLRTKSFGFGITKMIAFWESPWSNFLFLDADTIVWGDVFKKFANFYDYDFIIDRPCRSYSDANISHYFFDIAGIEKHFPDFNWRDYRDNYFCTRTFFAKREIFKLDDYKGYLTFMSQNPSVFKFGEMGLLNFMIFQGLQSGKIRVKWEDMQWLVPDFPQSEVAKRFPVGVDGSVVSVEDANVIHWCGPKPISNSKDLYVEPMTFCRRKFMQDAWSQTGFTADASIKFEDLIRYVFRCKNKFRKKFKALKGISALHNKL